MTSLLALYRGETISSAELVAVSADNGIVRDFAARLVTSPEAEAEAEPRPRQSQGNEKGNPATITWVPKDTPLQGAK